MFLYLAASVRRVPSARIQTKEEVERERERETERRDMADERSFIMVKPDGVQRGLVGEIVKRFEQKGFKLIAMKSMKV